jgi:ADP-ribose pyrophosphatase
MTELSGLEQGRHEFATMSTQDIYRGNIMALRADEVAMPGGKVARREVIEHFGAVVVAALDEHDRLVMIHQYRHPLGHRLWELPAGLLDEPGEPPHDAARRELVEEAGIEAGRWDVLADVAVSPGLTDECARVYLARDLSEVDRPGGEDDEEADLVIRRIAVSEALRMVFAGEIINSEAVVGVLATHAVLTGAAVGRTLHAPWPDRPTRLAARPRR